MFYNMKAQIDSGEQCQKEYRNHRDYRNRRKWKGSIVVEASYLLPFTLVLKLFSGLRTISEVMEKYLLSPEDLLLLPEFVYMDMATGEYSFIYYPERMGEENTSFRDLNEFFMQHMDSENILLVEAVYQMTDLLNRQQFVLDELITWFQENYDEEQMEERIHEQNVTMAQSNWNPNMQTQNLYRNQGSQSREAPVQNVSWNRGTQEMKSVSES